MSGRGAVQSIDARTAAARLVADDPAPLLIDVRETIEFAGGRAAEAVLMPLSGLAARVDELPKDRQLFIVCQVGQRSATVVDYLLKNGWVDVSNIDGGMDAWERAGLPVKRGAPTAEELGRRP